MAVAVRARYLPHDALATKAEYDGDGACRLVWGSALRRGRPR
jgi:hypothetical protein